MECEAGEVYQKNINYISARNGSVCEPWFAEASGHAEIIKKPDGSLNIQVHRPDNYKFLLHSKYNPEKEAQRGIHASGVDWAGKHAVLYGMGAGYHVAALSEAVGGTGRVTVLECNPDIAVTALNHIDLSSLDKFNHVTYLVGPDYLVVPALMRTLEIVEKRNQTQQTRMYVHQPSLSCIEQNGRQALLRETIVKLKGVPVFEQVADKRNAHGAFDRLNKHIVSGAELDDMDMALLFAESAFTEDRYSQFTVQFNPQKLPDTAQRILFLNLSSIGDVAIASGALAGLREKYPDARIVFLTEQPNPALYERCENIDRVIGYSRGTFANMFFEDKSSWEQLQNACREYISLINELRNENFDLVINFHNSVRSAIIAGHISEAKTRYGYVLSRHMKLSLIGNDWAMAKWLKQRAPALPFEEDCLRVLGLAPEKRRVQVCVTPASPDAQNGFPAALTCSKNKPVIGINPVCSVANRIWGLHKFRELAEILAHDMACEFIVFAGPAREEKHVAELICTSAGENATVCAGESIDRAAWISGQCTLFISNDTGPMHLAGAAGARCLVIGGPTRNLPYSTLGHVLVCADMPCLGCSPYPACEHFDCFNKITPGEIAQLASRMIESEPRDYLHEFAGNVADGKFPHLLNTTGIHDSLTPRFSMPIRSRSPIELTIAAEFSRIAAFNLMQILASDFRKDKMKNIGANHPGLATPFSADVAAREVLRRYDFLEVNKELLKNHLENLLETVDVSNTTPGQNGMHQLAAPLNIFILFLKTSGNAGRTKTAEEIYHKFVGEVIESI